MGDLDNFIHQVNHQFESQIDTMTEEQKVVAGANAVLRLAMKYCTVDGKMYIDVFRMFSILQLAFMNDLEHLTELNKAFVPLIALHQKFSEDFIEMYEKIEKNFKEE